MANPNYPGVEVLTKDFKRDDNDNVLCNDRVRVKFDDVILDLAQSWENGEEMAPIFSGACWAGTVVWQAALDLCDYMSEHLRRELVGATVVELGCGIGVPGMVARLLGATVILTEQDELLSLLDRNLTSNFEGHDEGIRWAALDWEREVDTDGILASLPGRVEGGVGPTGSAVATARAGAGKGAAEERLGNGIALNGRRSDSAEISSGENGAELVGRRSTRLEFILCADCVFEPLYGDSWKALAKVMGRLSDAGTTVLCSVERRGDDGVPRFLAACRAEGFALQIVFRAAQGAPAPVELYEFSKDGRKGFRGAAVSSDCRAAEAVHPESGGEALSDKRA